MGMHHVALMRERNALARRQCSQQLQIRYLQWYLEGCAESAVRCLNKMLASPYVCMYVCVHVCMHVRTYVCVYVCVYICMYVCMYFFAVSVIVAVRHMPTYTCVCTSGDMRLWDLAAATGG